MTVIQMRGVREAPKAERSRMETLLLTPEIVQEWRIPPFQRPLRVNQKVMEIAEKLKENGGIIKGVIWLGTLGADRKTHYLYDGQHRIEAAKISGLEEFIADVGVNHFDTIAEMAEEFAAINTQIVRMKPDDMMRALEASLPQLRLIRKECPFVGYDNIRRGGTSPLLSMSAAIRCWMATYGDTPAMASGGQSALASAQALTMDEAEGLCVFLKVARIAWGNEHENNRLWSNLNMSITMWLWRQLVKTERTGNAARVVKLNTEQFKRCMMFIASSRDYVDWLVGRNMNERDRAPCYGRVKAVFVQRLKLDGIQNPKLPQPAWASR